MIDLSKNLNKNQATYLSQEEVFLRAAQQRKLRKTIFQC